MRPADGPPRRVLNWPFVAAAIAMASAMFYFGGWPWGVVCLLVIVAQVAIDARVGTILIAIIPSLLWLALSRQLDNRELFFPFTMLLATHVSLLFVNRGFLASLLMGNFVVAGFTVIRILQDVTTRVLLVELTVSTGVLVIAFGVTRTLPQSRFMRAVIAAWTSLLAFAGLAIEVA